MKFRVLESKDNVLDDVLEGEDVIDILDKIAADFSIDPEDLNTSLDGSSGDHYQCVIFNKRKLFMVLEPM